MNHLITTVLCGLLLSGAATAAVPRDVAYVSNQDGGITVIDLKQWKKVKEIGVEGKVPRGLGITADGRYLITANRDTADASVIDTTTEKVIKRIAIGKNPEFVRVYGGRAYITYEPSSEGGPPGTAVKEEQPEDEVPAAIAVVDLKTWQVVQTLPSGREAEGTEFSSDGKLMLVANEGDDTIAVYEVASGKQIDTIRTGEHGKRPRGIKLSPDGRHYFITLEFSEKVLVLDRELNAVRTLPTGESPYGLAFDKNGRRLFVVAAKAKELQVLDVAKSAKIVGVPVGQRCWHLSFTPDYRQIMVTCGRSHDLHVIDADTLITTKVLTDFKLPWGLVTYPKSSGSLDAP
jgi:YVTN family beta-propeller protein